MGENAMQTADHSGPCMALIVGQPAGIGLPSPAVPSPTAVPHPPPQTPPPQDLHSAEIAALKRELFEARRQAALGELLGTTTHEFNNALTTILNYARMGLRHRDQATRDKALERILSAGQRAAKITASVLTLSRGRANRFEPVDLTLLVEDVLVLLEREMMKYRVQVEREFSVVPRVTANPNQLQQVLLNLLVNARQAMPTGGRLILRLSPDPTTGFVDLMVRDTGCGMTPDVMRRMFEPHFSTKSGPDETGKGGSGLGLAACKEIIEAHRGRIRVESAPGKGTAITLRLPTG
jgi:signal transduction histidine kinase